MPMKNLTHEVISKEKQHKIDYKSNNECSLKIKMPSLQTQATILKKFLMECTKL